MAIKPKDVPLEVKCTFGCADRFVASKQTSSPWGDMSGRPSSSWLQRPNYGKIHHFEWENMGKIATISMVIFHYVKCTRGYYDVL